MRAYYVYGTKKREAKIIKITKKRIIAEVVMANGETKTKKFHNDESGEEIPENKIICGGRIFIIK